MKNAQAILSVRQEFNTELNRLVDIFRLEHKQYGDHDLWVADPDKYLWYGPYNTGKLAVYQAAISPITNTVHKEFFGLVFCYQDSHDATLNAAGAMIYPSVINPRTSLGFFLEHVTRVISESQAVVLAKQVSDGNVSIH